MSPKICGVGDIMLGENLHHYGRGIPRRFSGRYTELLSPDVRGILQSADLLLGNFEGSLLPDSEWQAARLERAIYTAPVSALAALAEFRPRLVLNVANNHFAQHGPTAATDTVRRLEALGYPVIGKDFQGRLIESQGRRIRLWGVSMVEDPRAGAGRYACCEPGRLPDILDLPATKPDDEFWVLSVHWGEEYRTCPSPEQRAAARRLAGAGMDLVLGHHPHVLQPVERIGSCRVVYSHGNFIFDQNFSGLTRRGLITVHDSASGDSRFWTTFARRYRVESVRAVSEPDISAWAGRRDSRWNPLQMRILMKLEWLFHAGVSNRETFRFFLRRLLAKLGL